jgi:TPR repeat protein
MNNISLSGIGACDKRDIVELFDFSNDPIAIVNESDETIEEAHKLDQLIDLSFATDQSGSIDLTLNSIKNIFEPHDNKYIKRMNKLFNDCSYDEIYKICTENIKEKYNVFASMYYIARLMWLSDKYLNHDKGIEIFKTLSETGYTPATYRLGYMVKKGLISYNKHFLVLYHKAAYNGNTQAMYNLAMLYKKGKHVEKSLDQCIFWLKSASHHDCTRSLNMLGDILKDLRKYKESFMCYKKSHDLGNFGGTYNCSMMYYFGFGVKEDGDMALYYIKLYCKHLDDFHQYYLIKNALGRNSNRKSFLQRIFCC